jgi:uncharacterized protein YndB with AHSA1/START domain
VATFAVQRDVAAPARQVWDLVTNWPAHGRWVPLTRVRVTSGGRTGGVGTRFVGRTGLGPVGFDDPMEVVRWQPPGAGGDDDVAVCTVRKRGRLLLGWAEVRVTPLGAGRCRLRWMEDVAVAPVRFTRWADPLVAALGRLAFGAVLRSVAREVEAPGGEGRG